MTELDVVMRLSEVLVRVGVPQEAIFNEMEICTGAQRPYRADLLVVASDKKTPLFVFEIKIHGTLSLVYQNARRQMAGALILFPCFVVATKGDGIFIAKIEAYDIKDDDWISLSDYARLRNLIGEYQKQSDSVILHGESVSQRLGRFRNGIVVTGTLIILISYIMEMVTGKVMSYQLMGFLGLVFVLYAASYGVVKDIKVGGNQVSFHSAGDMPEDNSTENGLAQRGLRCNENS